MDRQGISSLVFHNNDGAYNYNKKNPHFGLERAMQVIDNITTDLRHSEARRRDYFDNKLSAQKEEQDARMEEIRTLLINRSSLHHPQVTSFRSGKMMQAQVIRVHISMATTITFVIHIVMKGKSPPSIMCTTTMNDIYYELKCDNDNINMKMLHKRKRASPNKPYFMPSPSFMSKR